MIKVGITGAMGSGKTTVCKLLQKQYGIPIYYADHRAKYLMNHDVQLKQSIKELLGKNAYHKNGRLDRGFVAKKIFSNKALIKKINALVHPAVYEDGEIWFKNLNEKIPYAIKEAAILFESKSHLQLDKVIVVAAPKSLRVQRIIKRDGTTKEAIEKRMKNQWPQERKVKLADFVIQNTDRMYLKEQVHALHEKLILLSKK